jgi:hypothetical protein
MKSVIIVIVIVLLFLGYCSYNNAKINGENLSGMWEATDEFLEKAEISGMYMYIGDEYKFGKRKAHILMHDNGKVIASMNVDLQTSFYLSPIYKKQITLNATVKESDSETDEELTVSEIMPEKVILTYSECHLQIRDSDGAIYFDATRSSE